MVPYRPILIKEIFVCRHITESNCNQMNRNFVIIQLRPNEMTNGAFEWRTGTNRSALHFVNWAPYKSHFICPTNKTMDACHGGRRREGGCHCKNNNSRHEKRARYKSGLHNLHASPRRRRQTMPRIKRERDRALCARANLING